MLTLHWPPIRASIPPAWCAHIAPLQKRLLSQRQCYTVASAAVAASELPACLLQLQLLQQLLLRLRLLWLQAA
jgi:hypothetical protein